MWDDLLLYIAVGFAAQMVDGAIGMAYGITATSVMLSAGISPATASACVHAAETFTTAASGAAHWRLGNLDRRLVLRLAVPGVIGGALGAYVLASLPGDKLKPAINAYLLIVGVVILWRAWRLARGDQRHAPDPNTTSPFLGLFGGLFDAIGGGGWGAIVTSTLISNGTTARTAIGSVNIAEFFVTAVISATFIATIGIGLWPAILGLVIGGVLAAPIAAMATRHLPERLLMALVGVVIVALSTRGLLRWLAG